MRCSAAEKPPPELGVCKQLTIDPDQRLAIHHFASLAPTEKRSAAPCRLIRYDDYASHAHAEQTRALDAFAAECGVEILSLPTGQGLLLRP